MIRFPCEYQPTLGTNPWFQSRAKWSFSIHSMGSIPRRKRKRPLRQMRRKRKPGRSQSWLRKLILHSESLQVRLPVVEGGLPTPETPRLRAATWVRGSGLLEHARRATFSARLKIAPGSRGIFGLGVLESAMPTLWVAHSTLASCRSRAQTRKKMRETWCQTWDSEARSPPFRAVNARESAQWMPDN